MAHAIVEVCSPPDGTRYAPACGITERPQAQEHLAHHMEELARFNRLAVGREHHMIVIKWQVNQLLQEAGKPPARDLSFVPRSERNRSAPRTAEAG